MIDSFELHLLAERKSPKTIRTYTEAAQWLAAPSLPPAGITTGGRSPPGTSQRWIVGLVARYSDTYANNQFRALQQFFKWYSAEDPADPRPNPMAGLQAAQGRRQVVPVFTDAELAALLAHLQGRRIRGRRDRAISDPVPRHRRALGRAGRAGLADVSLESREALVTGRAASSASCGSARHGQALDRYQRERARHRLAARPGCGWAATTASR